MSSACLIITLTAPPRFGSSPVHRLGASDIMLCITGTWLRAPRSAGTRLRAHCTASAWISAGGRGISVITSLGGIRIGDVLDSALGSRAFGSLGGASPLA